MAAKRNSIIAMWVHPRSMSTAIERIMRERGDLQCLHEPFMYYYYVGLGKKNLPHAKLDIGNPTDFNEIVSDLNHRSRSGSVFFKDMSYYVLPEILEHKKLAGEIQHLILIRNPRKSILSYYRLDPDVSIEEIGLEAHWNLYQWLCEHGRRRPYIIRAESVQENPVSAMTAVWKYLGLTEKPRAFHWESEEIPEDWQTVTDWHKNVIASRGIQPNSENEEETENRFDEAAVENPRLAELLAHHLPFYEKLKRASARQNIFDEG